MKPSDLRVGDKIRITSVPGVGIPGYYIHKDTVKAFKRIIARKRPVRIKYIDRYGAPWYEVRFRLKDGKWEWHSLGVFDGETNWVLVKPRKTSRKARRQAP